jgi:hypothetical protein
MAKQPEKIPEGAKQPEKIPEGFVKSVILMRVQLRRREV